MTQKIHHRFPAALAIAACLSFLCLCTSQAEPAAAWDGYTVIAQDNLETLHAAVVKDPDTGALLLVIGETKDGAFTETTRGEHAIPADWDEHDISVELYAAGDKFSGPSISVSVPANDSNALYHENFILGEAGWELTQQRGEYEGKVYSVVRLRSGEWLVYIDDSVRRIELKAQAIDTSLQTFDFEQVLMLSAAAIREKYERQDAALREQVQAAFAGTPWADATPIHKIFHYADGEIAAILTVLQTGSEEAVCVFAKNKTGVWEAAMNAQIIAPDTDTKDFSIEFPNDLDIAPGGSVFILYNHAAPGDSEYYVVRDTQDVWKVYHFGFMQTDNYFWGADFNGDVMQLYAGGFIAEEGYLYGTVDPQLTVFETFSIQQTVDAMYELYDGYMAGEPPLIPDDGSAYALPQPCGAELKQGEYPVYSGPGAHYYREVNGKAAVSSNDWVQVFGTDGDWVLIQYRVDGPLLRFGYIPIDAMENPDDVPRLAFESVSLTSTENGFITSNPLGIGGKITLPRTGFPMTRLGTLGEYWMYVELILPNGQPARMFAEVQATHG